MRFQNIISGKMSSSYEALEKKHNLEERCQNDVRLVCCEDWLTVFILTRISKSYPEQLVDLAKGST